jgi:O-antigen ligase
MPISFAGPIKLSKKDWERLAFLFILLILGGTIWGMLHYLSDPIAAQQAYLRSKIIETPLENDHVRFSWLVSIAILIAGWLGFKKIKTNSMIAGILFIISIWLIIFLHILAARTGLLSLYIISLFIILWLTFKKMKRIYGISFLIVLASLPFIAYFIFPTFQNRVKYFFYDFSYFKEAHYLPQTTDAVRVISLKAGWNIMNERPLTGVGFGDIFLETKSWYKENYPSMIEVDKIFPSNEWLMYGSGAGWIGFILFTIIIAIPFFLKKIHNKFLWCVLNASILCLFLFDITLEIQFGIFIYSFIILCWWKRSTIENIKS